MEHGIIAWLIIGAIAGWLAGPTEAPDQPSNIPRRSHTGLGGTKKRGRLQRPSALQR